MLGHRILICGGLLASGATTGSIIVFDVQASRFSSSGGLAAPVHDAGAASLSGLALIFGGGSGTPTTVVQRVGIDFRSAVVGHLPMARADLSAVATGNRLFVVGGGTPQQPDRTVLATTDGVQFHGVATLPIGVRYAAVVASAGLIYVFGGSTPSGDSTAIQVINSRAGTARVIGRLPHGLSHASAFELGGRIFIAGGRSAGRPQTELWRFDPATAAITAQGHLPYAVSDAAPAVVDGVGYLIGGEGTGGMVASMISLTPR